MGPVQLLRLARGYLADGRHMEALVVTKKGAKEFPSFAVEFSLLLAEVYQSDAKSSQAKPALEEALQSHPDEQRLRDALRGLDV